MEEIKEALKTIAVKLLKEVSTEREVRQNDRLLKIILEIREIINKT